jgi:drug/metabolite transporter (DMT)-like permease
MKKRLPELLLLLAAAIWGGTFLATRTALAGIGPFSLVFLRFAIGAVVIGAFVRRRPTASEIQGAVLIAVVTTIALVTQTIGLKTVESARAAFITALYVPLVPLLQGPLTGRRPTLGVILGAIIAFLGLAALASDGELSIRVGLGEVLMLVGALASALQIVLVGRFAASGDPLPITAVQLAGVALLALSGVANEPMHFTPTGLVLAGGLGLIATAGGYWAMNYAQRTVSPGRATLIYALEPVFAALFGVLAGEKLGVWGCVGGGLVLAGALVGEFLPERRMATA